jgi:hypothetical protein
MRPRVTLTSVTRVPETPPFELSERSGGILVSAIAASARHRAASSPRSVRIFDGQAPFLSSGGRLAPGRSTLAAGATNDLRTKKIQAETLAVAQLILRRASASRLSSEWNDDDFDVLADGLWLVGS